MPEGDSIRNMVARFELRLVGQTIRSAASRWPSAAFALAGRTIEALEPHGKNLWIELDDGNALRIHLGMRGRWRWLAAGERHLGSLGNVSLLLAFDHGTAVCTGAPTVERLPAKLKPLHPVMGALGPDLLAADFDVEAAIARLPSSPARTVAEVLLDQRVAAGIGNVYKAEALFVQGIDPFAPPERLDHAAWVALYGSAREMMTRNLVTGGARGPRQTTPPGCQSRYWVYGRGARPCLRCGTRIECLLDGGGLPRHTWWCPTCQPPTDVDRAPPAA